MRKISLISFILALTSPALAASSAGSVLATVRAAKAAIGNAPNLKAKLARLAELKSYLATEKRALKRIQNDEQRALHFTIHGLVAYFGEIPEDFSPKRCGNYHDAILFSFSPNNDNPDVVPTEAQEAFDVLDLLCRS